MMEKIKTYPMLMKENKFFGLEWIDFLLMLGVYLFVFLLSKILLLNLFLITMSYVALRVYKRNKPPRYTERLIRRLILPFRYTQAFEEKVK